MIKIYTYNNYMGKISKKLPILENECKIVQKYISPNKELERV